MNTTLRQFEGLRACSSASTAQQPVSARVSRGAFRVVAQKKVVKKEQVVLTKDIAGLGTAGELKAVAVGYYRNYLLPQGLASIATTGILAEINAQREAEVRAAAQEREKAQALATALKTIGKFVIKKKVGENNQIFGSVTSQDIVDVVNMQTGRTLDKKSVSVPDIKELGTYDVTVQLHPQVMGLFKVAVQKE